MPEEVMVYYSGDGISWSEFGQSKNTIAQTADGAILHDFAMTNTVQARYVKVKAKNPGVCPEWHPGKGKSCWIFADEIQIDAR
jgi:hexosaminidase